MSYDEFIASGSWHYVWNSIDRSRAHNWVVGACSWNGIQWGHYGGDQSNSHIRDSDLTNDGTLEQKLRSRYKEYLKGEFYLGD